jgi:hypothetical protein
MWGFISQKRLRDRRKDEGKTSEETPLGKQLHGANSRTCAAKGNFLTQDLKTQEVQSLTGGSTGNVKQKKKFCPGLCSTETVTNPQWTQTNC